MSMDVSEVAERVEERIGRREKQAQNLTTYDCDCYPGGFSPATYEGPQRECPVHGDGRGAPVDSPAWVLADCERDRRALARAVEQAERHEGLQAFGMPRGHQLCSTCEQEAWPCPDSRDADAALVDLAAKHEAWA